MEKEEGRRQEVQEKNYGFKLAGKSRRRYRRIKRNGRIIHDV